MPHSIQLPDAMPEITTPTLLVVCDSHHCIFFGAGGHTLALQEDVHSREPNFTDRQGSKPRGKGGVMIGIGESDQVEDHRLHEFANVVAGRIGTIVTGQKIGAVHVSAPGKFLSQLKKHLPKAVEKLVESAVDGNFVRESPLALLIRFRPDLRAAVQELRNRENYSAKKHLPR